MKKIISVLMVAVCLMMAAPAQAQLHFGVKGGLNISKLSFSKDAFKGDNKTGFFVGPMAEFTLPIIGIGADVAALYSQTDLGADGEKTMKLKTFAVPVNLKWSFGLGSMLGAYIAAGPQFGFNIGNKKGFMDYELKKTRVKMDGSLSANEYVTKDTFDFKTFPQISIFQCTSNGVPEEDIAEGEISGIIRAIKDEVKGTS